MKIKRLALALALSLALSACSSGSALGGPQGESSAIYTAGDRSKFLTIATDDVSTADPQCTSEYYTLPLNLFDRLVEVQANDDGTSEIVPSLARSLEISPDGCTYTFHLCQGVTFSNGSALTASDVLFTFERMLTHPGAVNQDLFMDIDGASQLRAGTAEHLTGFQVVDDFTFRVRLTQPSAPFLACLSAPGASILDEESTLSAGARFGTKPAYTVGTGPFVLSEWERGNQVVLTANPDCWSGAPRCQGIVMQVMTDGEAQRLRFDRKELDILDLDDLGSEAEYFVHGDIYQQQLHQRPRVGISYIALNATITPLNDVRIRKALQLALDRKTLLDVIYSGRGNVENGILPQGLIGHNAELEEIPYDPEQAKELMKQAGREKGFHLDISVPDSASQTMMDILELTAHMWRKIGIDAQVKVLEESRFMEKRREGLLACYSSTWSADYNDPDNFFYTFFGSRENTDERSLCYPNTGVMARVRRVRTMTDQNRRMEEYHALEKRIIQEDAAWVPLFSREHLFVVNDRVDGFQVAWNGWSATNYRNVAIEEE